VTAANVESSEWPTSITVAAELFGIRVSTSAHSPCSDVQQFVVALVLTDDQITVRVIGLVLVYVMHHRQRRQMLSQRGFSDENMGEYMTLSIGTRMPM
jgi:hypothetical protein